MPINYDEAMAAQPRTKEISWEDRDVLLYHLSLGIGQDNLDIDQLRYAYEKDLKVLPTFSVVAGSGISAGKTTPMSVKTTGIDIDLRKILHGGEAITLHKEIPAAGTATVTNRIKDIYDKGKAAVIVMENSAVDSHGDRLWDVEMQIFARGEGGFGGDSGPEVVDNTPDREPDFEVLTPTDPQIALLYRLNGDNNPLHADPEFAKMAGFDKPILHGLASYGLACKAVVDTVCEGDPARLGSWGVRFAGIMFPGETLRTLVWRDGDNFCVTATAVERDNAPVLSHGVGTVR